MRIMIEFAYYVVVEIGQESTRGGGCQIVFLHPIRIVGIYSILLDGLWGKNGPP